MIVLVVNCGSSSIKYQLFDMPDGRVLSKGQVERIGQSDPAMDYTVGDNTSRTPCAVKDHEEAMALILETITAANTGVVKRISDIHAVGHRVVHGGEAFTGSVVITPEVIASIEKVADLAPLHNPPNLTGIRAAMHRLPHAAQVACFDTAFHTTIPETAYLYALPLELYQKYGIRRYGFHGTSHRWVARRAAELLGKHKYGLNCITCHLGNGSSMTAVRDGKSVDTSMGLTPLEGLVMGTRTGDFDPAILFYLTDKGYDVAALNALCNKKSGVLGLSGISNDMRELGAKAAAGDKRARLAIDVFCYRIKKYIGAYSAVLGRVDAVIFTGGIGENGADLRAQMCADLQNLGIEIDPQRNAQTVGRREGRISSDAGKVAVLVIPTNEEAAIANDTYSMSRELLGKSDGN